ncbi:MAG TPA: hypothetical protein VNY84_03775 [Acidimicrobiales bacterium]|nr:hypothetical protein [Acidimicrobiales bacterium]
MKRLLTAIASAVFFVTTQAFATGMPASATPGSPGPTIDVGTPSPDVISLTGGQESDAPGGPASVVVSAQTPGGFVLPPEPFMIPPPCPAGFTPGLGLFSFCVMPGSATAPPPPPPPGMVASQAWQHLVPLPHPTAGVKPGEAIVGHLAYLEIGGPQTIQWSGVALGVPVSITATSTYDVDWGDGTPPDTGLTTQGGPWPTGTITHAYQFAGDFVITVTQRWTANWTAEGASGTIANALFTTGTLPLPAREVQANRDH